MGDSGRKTRLLLAFVEKDRGEAPKRPRESLTAKRGTASPEEVCERENCRQALRRVKANNGSAGVDGMTVWQSPEFLK
jgi:RNA-directed DNA polymerase